ncbi:hypothetical protein BRADI_4g03497v3 [Brachypodium distachyon]|uniref:Uncharacterized protein n=1 Tax=Brachypodium distachyon TaxID=15368 RepID=A0A2K2CK83_BRADI|nr:hypothetical protein BRADI_4g03497v3 [Brachypodium distachyon]
MRLPMWAAGSGYRPSLNNREKEHDRASTKLCWWPINR